MKNKVIVWLLKDHPTPGYSLAVFWAIIFIDMIDITIKLIG